MKRVIISVLCCVLAFSAMAQDTTHVDKVIENVQSGSRDRLVFEYTFVNWAQLDGKQVNTKWWSRGFNIYFMYDLILGKSNFSFAPGIGLGLENVHTEKGLYQDTASTSFVPYSQMYPASSDYKKHKLQTVYVDIPLELRFRSKPNAKNKSFKLSVGFKGGVMVDNHTKMKYEGRGGSKVIKTKNYSDIMRFRFGPTFRIGYGAFNIVAYYNLNELFNSNGPQGIHPFAAGISINGL